MQTLQQAAQAVVNRWDSPMWDWTKEGPTADLIADLRKALEQPIQHQWIGLTAAERKEIERKSVYVEGAIRLTETKLMKKNNE